MLNQYFNYLNQVLGIRNPLFPATEAVVFSDFLFLTEQDSFTEPESELFLKMVSAMKLSNQDFQIKKISLQEITTLIEDLQNAKVIICLESNIYQYLQVQFPHANLFLISHPKEMLQNPNLKKATWEELKRALSVLAQ